MADPAPRRRESLRETVRSRILAASGPWTHKQIAERMTAIGRTVVGPDFRPVSRQKVSEVIGGRSSAQLEELDIWAMALDTSVDFLLGRTWTLRPEQASPAATVSRDTPG